MPAQRDDEVFHRVVRFGCDSREDARIPFTIREHRLDASPVQ